jgi:shikimate 5-dehydrogenase
VLKHEGAIVTVFARQVSKAKLLADELGLSAKQLDNSAFKEFDLVVNATPLGTAGALEGETVATAEQLYGAGFVYDLVYNPKETRLMREARAAGCKSLGGASMLVTQAAAQFKLWTGVEAPNEVMAQAAELVLGSIQNEGTN